MAVGEGNYGRLGPNQQQRFTTANRRVQLPDPDEQPGAMPEIVPSPGYQPPQLDRKFTERAMVLQAWGNYGTAWPVVHQQLGVRPDAGRARARGRAAGARGPAARRPAPRSASATRRGRGRGLALRQDATRTRVKVGAPITKLAIGHTLPAGATVATATLDGQPVTPETRTTNRGLEVTVPTSAGTHTLVVTAGELSAAAQVGGARPQHRVELAAQQDRDAGEVGPQHGRDDRVDGLPDQRDRRVVAGDAAPVARAGGEAERRRRPRSTGPRRRPRPAGSRASGGARWR